MARLIIGYREAIVDGKDFLAFGVTFASMAFGFGRQSAEIRILRRDAASIALGTEILAELREMNKRLERLDQRVLHCEKD